MVVEYCLTFCLGHIYGVGILTLNLYFYHKLQFKPITQSSKSYPFHSLKKLIQVYIYHNNCSSWCVSDHFYIMVVSDGR